MAPPKDTQAEPSQQTFGIEGLGDPEPPPKPIVKWIGGKRSLIPELLPRIPRRSSFVYHEPFFGGGALFFTLRKRGILTGPAFISDVNRRLMDTYIAIRDDVDRMIAMLHEHKALHGSDYYYSMREVFNDPGQTDPFLIGSLLIYFNKTCYNGLYRENQKGGFNASLGTYVDPVVCDEDNLRAAAIALQGTDIRIGSFRDTVVVDDGFYYLDPPYDDTFTGYTQDGFDSDDQAAVAHLCRNIDAAGGRFLLSNSDTGFIRSLYEGFRIETTSVYRAVAPGVDGGVGRTRENEVLVRNYGWGE